MVVSWRSPVHHSRFLPCEQPLLLQHSCTNLQVIFSPLNFSPFSHPLISAMRPWFPQFSSSSWPIQFPLIYLFSEPVLIHSVYIATSLQCISFILFTHFCIHFTYIQNPFILDPISSCFTTHFLSSHCIQLHFVSPDISSFNFQIRDSCS